MDASPVMLACRLAGLNHPSRVTIVFHHAGHAQECNHGKTAPRKIFGHLATLIHFKATAYLHAYVAR